MAVADAGHFSVVKKPLLTEKTANQQVHGVYCFEVAEKANKIQIKAAVEAIWNVRVAGVRTVNAKGEQRRDRNGYYQTASVRKAYVKLRPGYEIEVV